MRRSVVAVALAVALSGCSRDPIEVRKSADQDADFGRAEMRRAVDEFGKQPKSPAAFNTMATKIEALRGRFNQAVANEAERHLVFLAIAPMAAALTEPPAKMFDQLATNVWPWAFRIPVAEGESASDYVGRLCSGPLASECRFVVPESWPEVMNAKAWKRLRDRAKEAYVECSLCSSDPSYSKALEQFVDYVAQSSDAAAKIEKRSHPRSWPVAKPEAAAWSGVPLLSWRSDEVRFDGAIVEAGEWRAELRRLGDIEALGLHVRPSTQLSTLEGLLSEIRKAGHTEVALQCRYEAFPYSLAEYRLPTRSGIAKRYGLRSFDTVQVLVEAVAHRAANDGS